MLTVRVPSTTSLSTTLTATVAELELAGMTTLAGTRIEIPQQALDV